MLSSQAMLQATKPYSSRLRNTSGSLNRDAVVLGRGLADEQYIDLPVAAAQADAAFHHDMELFFTLNVIIGVIC